MPLKTLLDKAAWEWVESTQPEDVSNLEIETAYRIKIPSCKPGICRRNCKGNPQCLACLGEKDWFSEIADENWHEIDDPNAERRPDNSCVGLKNLGATCYVNSLLQLWYHNPTFRRAIYEWRNMDGTSGESQEKASSDCTQMCSMPLIGQLQYIFALLQYSCRRYIDPSPFIKSLGLNTAQQQDAQEFSKLFLARLEDELQRQSNPFVKNIVQSQFSGDYAYVTRCSRCGMESECPSQFYELQLNIKGHKQLSECVNEFLQDENLDGANQYSCGNCQSFQNAVRKIKLHRLPTVLNLQLLRFVFERETTRKRKLNTAITFPEVLDLNKYLGTQGNENTYNLAAVLIHRGPSAYSGHYVALIRNHLSGEWFKFNDEDVQKIDGAVLQLSVEEDAESDGLNRPAAKNLKTKGFHESKNAYMLVYTRCSDAAETGDEADDSEEWNMSEELHNAIVKDNEKFEEWVTEIATMRDQNVESGKAKQNEVKQLYEMLHLTADDSWDFLPTAWIMKWLRDNPSTAAIENSKMLCPHRRLHPDNAIKMKRVSSKAADTLYPKYGGGPRLQSESLCKDCVVQRCASMRLKNQLTVDTKLIVTLTKNKISDSDSAYWVGRMSMRRWKYLALKTMPDADCGDAMDPTGSGTDEVENADGATEAGNGHAGEDALDENGEFVGEEGPLGSFNEDIVCVHKNLNIKVGCRRLVTEKVWQRLVHYFPCAPSFGRDVEPCSLCQRQVAGDQEARDALKNAALSQRAQLYDIYLGRHRPHLRQEDSPSLYIVSTEFIQDLRRFLREPLRRPPVTQVNNLKLVCAHGGLLHPLDDNIGEDSKLSLVTEAEWAKMEQLFTVDTTIKVIWSRCTDQGPLLADTQPGLCLECHAECVREEERQLLTYESARIYISKVSSKETTEISNSGDTNESPTPTEDKELVSSAKRRKADLDSQGPSTVPSADPKRVRRSQRHRRGRDERTVVVSSKQTLRDLKVQIMDLFSVAPYDQHLTLEGRALVEGGATLAALRVLPESVVYLQVDEPVDDDLGFSDDYAPRGTPEEGFKGTELLRS